MAEDHASRLGLSRDPRTDQHRSPLGQPEDSEIEELVVEDAESESVAECGRPTERVPSDVSRLCADREAVEERLESADRAPMAVRAQHEFTESRRASEATRSRLRGQIDAHRFGTRQPDGGQIMTRAVHDARGRRSIDPEHVGAASVIGSGDWTRTSDLRVMNPPL